MGEGRSVSEDFSPLEAGLEPLLTFAMQRAVEYRVSVGDSDVKSAQTFAEVSRAFSRSVPEVGQSGLDVIEELDRLARPGLRESVGPRFFGWVIGGSHPVGVAADWLTSAWGQNATFVNVSPTAAAVESVAASWLLEILDLPREASVGFVTGATSAHLVGLAAARNALLRKAGWDVETDGLFGAPPVDVFVGNDAHATVFAALRYIGFGSQRVTRITTDDQGRMIPEALAKALEGRKTPPLLILQAGQINTGAFDPADALVPLAKAVDGWVHVDGAFGLWARACVPIAQLAKGYDQADSWATDGHKWLQAPFDSGFAIVRDADAHRRAMGISASYFAVAEEGRNPSLYVPELSRRARAFAIWALISHFGRQGIAAMIERHCGLAAKMAERLSAAPGVYVLNEVVLNQITVRFGEEEPGELGDRMTMDTVCRIQADNICYVAEARWRDRTILRLSVCSMATRNADIDVSCEAVLAAWRAVQDG